MSEKVMKLKAARPAAFPEAARNEAQTAADRMKIGFDVAS